MDEVLAAQGPWPALLDLLLAPEQHPEHRRLGASEIVSGLLRSSRGCSTQEEAANLRLIPRSYKIAKESQLQPVVF